MNKSDAQTIADRYLNELRHSCPVEIECNYAVTEEHPIGFVFFYNSKDYWETRDLSKSLAGNGPVLVLRESGKLVILPSHQSVKRSLLELVPPTADSPPS